MSKRWVTKCEYYKQTKNVLLEGENSTKKKERGWVTHHFAMNECKWQRRRQPLWRSWWWLDNDEKQHNFLSLRFFIYFPSFKYKKSIHTHTYTFKMKNLLKLKRMKGAWRKTSINIIFKCIPYPYHPRNVKIKRREIRKREVSVREKSFCKNASV